MSRHAVRVLPLALVAVATATGAVTARQGPVFRSDSQAVPVYVTVTAADGRLVTDLTQDDFEVFDNGRPQPITLFDAGTQPITIVVMLDTSGSMLGNIGRLRQSAVQMFTRIGPGDRARIGHFGRRIFISPRFTNDVDELVRSLWLDIELDRSAPTPLWGGVNAAMAALAPTTGRRVVLVLSDGYNTGLRTSRGIPVGATLGDVVERAQIEDFMVYAIGMRSRMAPPRGGTLGMPAPPPQWQPRTAGRSGPPRGRGRGSRESEPDPGLRALAAGSGGGYFELRDEDDLGAAFARVADELHRQYLLGFMAPEADGRLHELEIRVRDRSMQARARRNYRAPGPRVD